MTFPGTGFDSDMSVNLIYDRWPLLGTCKECTHLYQEENK